MKRIPLPVQRVEIPNYFSPTALVQSGECILKVVLGSRQNDAPRLPSHPAAELGKVLHTLLERSVSGAIHCDSLPEELSRLLVQTEQRLSENPETAHFVPLSETLSLVGWHNKRRDILMAVEAIRSSFDNRNSECTRLRGEDKPRVFSSSWPSAGRYAEVVVEAEELRLRGRLDSLEVEGHDEITIRDYKTGKIVGMDGTVDSKIVKQLRIYALAIASIRPNATLRALVSSGRETHEIGLGEDELTCVREWLRDLLNRLPIGETVESQSLANPGQSCRFCQHRHVCPSYLEYAPTVWRDGTLDGPLPNDVWGVATKVDVENDFISVEIRDPVGRRVRVSRLAARHAIPTRLPEETPIYFFGLGNSGKGVSNGRHFGPRNFFEIPIDDFGERAWSLAVFRAS